MTYDELNAYNIIHHTVFSENKNILLFDRWIVELFGDVKNLTISDNL